MGYSHGFEWDDKLICEKLQAMTRYMKEPKMPTHKEMNEFYHDRALSNAVSKHGGTKYFANLLNLPLKDCEAKVGDIYEDVCEKYIRDEMNLKVERMKYRYPYDLLVEQCVKIGVMSSKLFISSIDTCFYTFHLDKRKPTCDILVCYCIDENDKIVKTYVIPSHVLYDHVQLSIGVYNSLYDKYLDNWDLIRKYEGFYKKQLA